MLVKVTLILCLGLAALAKPAAKGYRSSRAKPRRKPREAPVRPTAHEFEGFPSKKGVIHVTKDTLGTLRQQHDFVVTLFGAHVCVECGTALNALQRIAPEVHAKGALVPFTYFLCEAEDSHCDQFEKVAVAPTLRIYHKNLYTEYTGIKNEEGIARWVIDRLLHSSHDATDQVREVRRLNRQSEVVIVLREDAAYRQFHEFRLLSILYEFGHFFYTKDAKSLADIEALCREQVGPAADSVLFVLNPEDSKCYYLSDGFNYKRALRFIVEHDKIGVTRFDENILKLQAKYQVPVAVFFTRDALNHPFYPAYQKVADEFKSRMLCAYVDEAVLGDPMVKRVMNTLGVDRRSFPALRVFLKQPDGFLPKWRYDGPLERPKVKAWLDRLLSRKLKPYTKSETEAELADKNEKGVLEAVSAANFEAKVEEERAPVVLLVEGSEEVCEDCAGLSQKILEAKDKYLERNGKFPFKMYRLNVQLNEVAGWVFDRVPQLLVVKRNKKVLAMEGNLEVNAIVSFMEEKLADDAAEAWRDDL